MKIHIKFDILVYGKTTNHINDIIDEVTKALRDEISINIIHIKSFNNWTHNLNQSAIILAESKKNLKILHQKLMAKSENDTKLANATPKQLKFLIYCENLTNLHSIIKNTKFERLSWTDFRFFQFCIIKAGNYVNLSAIVLFSEKKCGEFQIKFLNSFDIKTQKWN
ncbi:hypothetical protein PVAND_015669 [Polypedilum vanderplanki]|uniref:Uncharacterized protein n=1 Tax=Polypedilum vanderplanki TaxID=319348 RepID=A0A9J6BDB7_POLVA|nr:hypothetical protein PVAND_015669 [Polypedilum vanderplanki]